ncbi:hypothetical protein PV05_03839 [Exophiala xenobiotica]|uniref:Uncharacterized protein n=1 Tax=Exophiala xenobiotica TaxID=348802 RepID=A0A0D2C3H9_9EURO|nr:uncharacterized protein PV05_03839 [Exophiala xenobiotica]KIW59386.1 hypothetical protein PV05_03839 [Exophiala xenobiotica]
MAVPFNKWTKSPKNAEALPVHEIRSIAWLQYAKIIKTRSRPLVSPSFVGDDYFLVADVRGGAYIFELIATTLP